MHEEIASRLRAPIFVSCRSIRLHKSSPFFFPHCLPMRQPDAISLRELQEPLLEDGNHDCSDPQAEKDLVRRLDKRLLAFAMLGNLVKALDNSALGTAKYKKTCGTKKTNCTAARECIH